jgi:hypothetical protein
VKSGIFLLLQEHGSSRQLQVVVNSWLEAPSQYPPRLLYGPTIESGFGGRNWVFSGDGVSRSINILASLVIQEYETNRCGFEEVLFWKSQLVQVSCADQLLRVSGSYAKARSRQGSIGGYLVSFLLQFVLDVLDEPHGFAPQEVMLGIDFRHITTLAKHVLRSQGPTLGFHLVGKNGDIGTVELSAVSMVFD